MGQDRPRLALLMASFSREATRRNFRRELDADLAEFAAVEGDLPAGFDYDGYVVTGSRAAAYDDEPWIRDLIEWIDEAHDRELPGLGVCFGHQAMAAALGGTVEPMGEYELGYHTMERVGDSRLLAGIGDEFTVFSTHSDTVSALPPGAELIAENEYGVQGFRKDHAFGVQFHPEYDMQTAREVTEGKDGKVPEATIEAVLAGITDEAFAAACETKRLFENFTDFVRERRVERAAAD